MSKKKTYLMLLLCTLFSFVFLFGFFSVPTQKANAEESEIEPLGIYTKMTLSINGGNGQVWATAKNVFTLFPATVQVYVEIYYSYEYQESYTNMTLAERNYIYDLDQGKTIQAVGNTNGQTMYWQARARYKADSADWKELVTSTLLYDGDGNYLKDLL